jgi:hypothetical protein
MKKLSLNMWEWFRYTGATLSVEIRLHYEPNACVVDDLRTVNYGNEVSVFTMHELTAEDLAAF